MHYDVIVAGAGPAGATAAAVAASSGLRVLLAERSRFPRDKVCGDAISGKSLDVLRRLDLLDSLAAAESLGSRGVIFGSPSGHEVAIPFGPPDEPRYPGFICARGVFDGLLAARAQELGAELREETRVNGLLVDAGRVCGARLQSGGSAEDVRAPIVIGADGAYSAVARALGFRQLDEHHYYGAVRAYYSDVDGFRGDNYIELHFIDQAIPGYFWIFPMAGGRANVGLGTLSARLKRKRVGLKQLLEETIASPRFRDRFRRARQVGAVSGWGMPLGSSPRKMAGHGWMLAGDAASLIDPFTGEGIGNAMVTGRLAGEWARRALDAGEFGSSLLSGYEDEVRRTLGPELQVSYVLRRLERWHGLLDLVIRKASRSPDVAGAISSMFHDLDARRRLTSPLFYLRMLGA